jgi:hypothetical protein
VGALTQTPGVTYEIPLANVAIDGAGAITLITDTRDFCEFSTIMPDASVSTDAIQDSAVTIAKMVDQDRWLTRGAGQFEADATNPAAWDQVSGSIWTDVWTFTTAADEYIWCTFRVPTDISSANMEVYLYDTVVSGIGDVRWTYNLFQAAAAGVLANVSGASVISYNINAYHRYLNYTLFITRAVTAGDIIHLRIGREGTHVTDTLAQDALLWLVRVEYTADS